MATHQISILGGNTVPDSTGTVFPTLYSTLATNDVFKMLVWVFQDSGAAANLYGQFTVPQNYVGTASVIPVWTAAVTTGNVVWNFDYRSVSGNDTTSMDQATVEESDTVTDAAPSAVNERLTAPITPTAANFAAGETIEFIFYRNGVSASDTMAADAILFDLLFQYDDA